MTVQERYRKVLETFAATIPEPETELHYENPFQLLVAVILSAQCTDKRINQVTPALFQRFPTSRDMSRATPEDVYPYIRSVTYPNNKSKALVSAARQLEEEFGGEMPTDIDNLMKLPGVGRKTANVMLAVLWNGAAMPVDTHVFRVSNRIGLTNNSKTPLSTERTLCRHIPDELLPKAHHWLILHGRYVCKSRTPDCYGCVISEYCKSYPKFLKEFKQKEEAKAKPKKK